MRPLEIMISSLLGVYLFWPHPRPTLIRLAPAAVLILTLIHFSVEGYRWQMVPLYALSALLAISALTMLLSTRDIKPLASYLTVILLAVSTALPILLPIPRIPNPSGSYPVGTTIRYLTDDSRKELYSGKDEPRRFMIQMWYPALAGKDSSRAPWMTDAEIYAPTLSTFLHLPPFFLDHLKLVTIPAYQDAPFAQPVSEFPIIIFSHGWDGFAAQNTGQAIELASHGYIVIGIQHTYGAIVTVFPDGTIAPNNPAALPEGAPDAEYEAAARQLVDQWAGDIGFTLDYLARVDTNFTLEHVGVFGHSTGGGAAIEFCGRDPRCKAVMGLDPFMRPVSLEVLENGLSQPAFFMFSQAWADDVGSRNNQLFFPFYAKAQQPLGVVSIQGTLHYDFTDLPMLSPIAPQLGLKGPINGRQMVNIMDSYLVAFFDETLKDKTAGLFDALYFPEVKVIH